MSGKNHDQNEQKSRNGSFMLINGLPVHDQRNTGGILRRQATGIFKSHRGKKQFKKFEEPHNSSRLKRQIERATSKRTPPFQGGSPCSQAPRASRDHSMGPHGYSGQKVPGTASDRSRKNLLPRPRWREGGEGHRGAGPRAPATPITQRGGPEPRGALSLRTAALRATRASPPPDQAHPRACALCTVGLRQPC